MNPTHTSKEIESGFYNHNYLNAVYGTQWREFKYIDEDGIFKYHPVLHNIPGTPYFYSDCWRGYFDPYFSTHAPSFINRALHAYSTWCKKNNIICEMIRIDPLSKIKNFNFNLTNLQITTGQPVSQIYTPESIEKYYSALPSPCQRNIKKAKGDFFPYEIQINDSRELKEMHVILNHSLERSHAAKKWFLNEEAFRKLVKLAEFKFIGIKNKKNDVIVSFAGFIQHQDSCQILLVGNNNNTQHSGACDLLYFSVVEDCIKKNNTEKSLTVISFGGGRSLSLDDPLIRFKLKYSLKQYTNCLYMIFDHVPEITEQLNEKCKNNNTSLGEPISQLHSKYFPFLTNSYGNQDLRIT